MSHWDAIGYFAAGMVFVAFGMKEMVPLRIVGMFSNMAFIAYGLGLDLTPVWLLHAVLLPLNGWHLAQALRSENSPPALALSINTASTFPLRCVAPASSSNGLKMATGPSCVSAKPQPERE
jgi:hypothetical protein